MDPFVITKLQPGADGKYSTKFILPDVYGLFTFKVHCVVGMPRACVFVFEHRHHNATELC